MKVLLDTHTLIWYRTAHPLLSAKARAALINSEKYISTVTLWEIALLIEKNKLSFSLSPEEYMFHLLNDNFYYINIELEHLKTILTLPKIHKDPFDRMLIAQAISNKITLITKDKLIAKYPVQTLW